MGCHNCACSLCPCSVQCWLKLSPGPQLRVGCRLHLRCAPLLTALKYYYVPGYELEKNKTQYFRLRLYDSDFFALWVLSECSISVLLVLSDCFMSALWILWWLHKWSLTLKDEDWLLSTNLNWTNEHRSAFIELLSEPKILLGLVEHLSR